IPPTATPATNAPTRSTAARQRGPAITAPPTAAIEAPADQVPPPPRIRRGLRPAPALRRTARRSAAPPDPHRSGPQAGWPRPPPYRGGPRPPADPTPARWRVEIAVCPVAPRLSYGRRRHRGLPPSGGRAATRRS